MTQPPQAITPEQWEFLRELAGCRGAAVLADCLWMEGADGLLRDG